MTTMDESMNWMKLTYLLSNFPSTSGRPFVNLHLLQNINNMYRCTKIALPYAYYVHLLTLTLVRTWYEESIPQG